MTRMSRPGENMNREIALIAALIVLTHIAGAAAAPEWDATVTGQEIKMQPTQAAPKPKTEKKSKNLVLPAAGAYAPEIVSSPEAFALTSDEIQAVLKEEPDPKSPLGQKLAKIMRQAYVGGAEPKPFKSDNLRVITWNINAADTDHAVAALLAVADNSPEGVQKALGRKDALKDKSAAELAKFNQNDVFLMQEIPLLTAIKLGGRLGAKVFWAPEFLEVGDNIKGRDPRSGDAYTGNAIISRVPLSDLKVLRFNNQADWYFGQKGTQPLGDKLTKIAAKTLFAADAGNPHQTRPGNPFGGRIAMFAKTSARFHAEGISGKEVWVGNLHLEDLNGIQLTGAELRRAQMAEARTYIKTVDGPILFGGDLNTMGNSPGVIEGEDIATEVPNLMNVSQAPIDRQSGLAAGVGNKFFGVVDAANLGTTLTHNLGGTDTILKRDKDGKVVKAERSRKKLAVEQAGLLAIDIAPYAPAAHDALNAAFKIKEQPKNVPRDLYYGGMTAADFFPYTAAAAKGFQIFWDERSRHNPTAKANADHNLFTDVKKDGDTTILNPTLGFRFGMGGYPATWTAGRPMMIPGISRGLANAVTDWLFLRDPDHQIQPAKGEVLKDMVIGSKAGNSDEKRLSDHYPLRTEIALTGPSGK